MNYKDMFSERATVQSGALAVREGENFSIALTKEAHAAIYMALELSKTVQVVSTPEQNGEGSKAQLALKTVLSSLESSRKEAKKPYLDRGRKIDDVAEQIGAPIEAEFKRVSKLVSDYQFVELEKARAAELAENKRLAELEIAKAKAIVKADTAEEIQDVIEHYNNQAQADTTIAPPRAEGQRVTQDWSITQIDLNTLYRHHSQCVKMEPVVSEIKALLNAGVKVAGVKAERVVKSDVRVTRKAVVEI